MLYLSGMNMLVDGVEPMSNHGVEPIANHTANNKDQTILNTD